MSKNTFDPSYLSTLLKEIHKGENVSEAVAGIFAATFKDTYSSLSAKVGNKYAAQDALKEVYTKVFSSKDSLAKDGKVFIKQLRNVTNDVSNGLAATEATGKLEGEDAEINNDEGGFVLQNVLSDLGLDQSEYPLDTLVSYNKYRKSRNVTQRIILGVVIAMVLAAPILMIPPKMTVTESAESTEWKPVYDVNVSSMFDVDSVIAYIGSNLMQVTQEADGTYVVTPSESGEMHVKTTLSTGKTAEKTVKVADVDKSVPTMKSFDTVEGKIHIVVEDAGSGIDYANVVAVTPEGKEVKPDSYDEKKGEIIFDMLETNTNISIPDKVGNKLTLVCSK